MKLFDFALLVGSDPRSPSEGSREDLVNYLDSEDAGGLVASLAGAYYDYAAGNRETLATASGDKRLLPAFTVDCRRANATQTDFALAAKEGFRALALFPAIQSWDLSHPAVGAVVNGAAAAALPIVLHLARTASVGALAALAREVAVPVIACGLSYGSLGAIVSAGRDPENLLFGTRLFAGLDNIDTLVQRIGGKKIVFDSGEPVWKNGAALEILKTAPMSEEARGLVMSGNARRIFGSVP